MLVEYILHPISVIEDWYNDQFLAQPYNPEQEVKEKGCRRNMWKLLLKQDKSFPNEMGILQFKTTI